MQDSVSSPALQSAGRKAALKTLPFILFGLAMLALAGCNGTVIGLGAAAGGIIGTRPGDEPPADLSAQMPQHETWCYETAGEPQCYAYPVKDANSRLINVDPPNRYPLTARAYHETVIESQQ